MKHFLIALFAGLFVINPTLAEQNNNDRTYIKSERKQDHKKRKYQEKAPGQWRILQNISAKERERLRQLHAADPESFKKEVAKIVKRIKEDKQKLDKKIQELVNQYKTSKDTEKKKEVLDQLHQITRKIFLEKMQKNKKRLESLEKHVKKLRQQYEFRQKNADKIIQSRINALTKDTNLDW